MKTAELFAGTKSFSKVAASLGHLTLTFEWHPKFAPDHCVDILYMSPALVPANLDVLWASPPCQAFSVASIGRNWHRDHTPKTATARLGVGLVRKTLRIIEERQPRWWFIENPRGKLRKMPFMEALTGRGGAWRHTVTYCQYGDSRMKPTDIWTNAWWWKPRVACANGDACHDAAPRGARTGTQGIKGAIDRSRVPALLFREIFAQMPAPTKQTVESRYSLAAIGRATSPHQRSIVTRWG
jgi:hypothetical protein